MVLSSQGYVFQRLFFQNHALKLQCITHPLLKRKYAVSQLHSPAVELGGELLWKVSLETHRVLEPPGRHALYSTALLEQCYKGCVPETV